MKKTFTFIIVALLLFGGMTGVAHNNMGFSGNSCSCDELPWVSTYVYLKNITTLEDRDDPEMWIYDWSTEMIFTASARIQGTAHAMTYATEKEWDNDADDGCGCTEFPQYRHELKAPLFYNVECSPVDPLEISIEVYESDGGGAAVDIITKVIEGIGKVTKLGGGFSAYTADVKKLVEKLFGVSTKPYATAEKKFTVEDVPVDGKTYTKNISYNGRFYAYVQITRKEINEEKGCGKDASPEKHFEVYKKLMTLHLKERQFSKEFQKLYRDVIKDSLKTPCISTDENVSEEESSLLPYHGKKLQWRIVKELLEAVDEIDKWDFEWGSDMRDRDNVEKWKEGIKTLGLKLLQSSAENMSELAGVFGPYTVDSKYDDYIASAENELSIADGYFESGEFAEAIPHYHNSWNFSRLAIGVADDVQPYATFDVNWTDGILTVNGYGCYDIAGPLICSPDNYTWDFGDGTMGYGIFEQHTYTSTGTYTVTLTVIDKADNIATASKEISVEEVYGNISLALLHPMDRYVYLFGMPFMPFPPDYHPEIHVAVLLGPIILRATAESEVGIEKVGFSIDGGTTHWKYRPPYMYFWAPPFGIELHAIEVIAYNNAGLSAADSREVITVWFLPGGEYGP